MPANFYILSKNYVNSNNTFNVSSNSADSFLLYDQSKAPQWKSSGETVENGSYSTYIEIIFYSGASAVNRNIDTIVLQNINLKAFKIQQFNGVSYSDIPEAIFSNNSLSTIRIKLATPINTAKIKIIMDSTIIANQEKMIGEIWCMLENYNLAFRSTRPRNDNLIGDNFRTVNGKLNTFYIISKVEFLWTLDNITDSVKDDLEAIYNNHSLICVYIDYDREPNSIYQGQWVNSFRANKKEPKIPITAVTFDFKEN